MTKRFLIFPWLFSLLSFHLVAGSFTFTTIGSASTQAHGINDSGQVEETIRPAVQYFTAF